MPAWPIRTAKTQRTLPLLAAVGALALAVPSTGFAVVSLTEQGPGFSGPALEYFTPASVDPDLAARVVSKARERGIRFTPATAKSGQGERTVTVAVRVDNQTAQAISVRSAVDAVPAAANRIAALQPTRYNLGTARGYQSFARQVELPKTVRDLSVPDLAEFEPARPAREDKPSRLQPRIALEDKQIAGRSENTLDSLGAQTVDVGGSFRLSPNLDVTAGVRLSQERERIDPLTNSVQDSQAVYVGTQIRF
ncbi:hypothetical protein KDC96_12135 [Erythrobacter sp. JK5]|nr:hypothetical protein KDC96_12135 [Erythrobacter sp. JK5]